MQKKKLITMVGAIALIGAVGIGSTFAFLTSTTKTVTNTFTVGNVNFEPNLGNGLTESKVARNQTTGAYEDADGTGVWSTITNDYTDLVAGEAVYKDPTVTMKANSEKAYVFAKITNANGTNATITYNTAEWTKLTTTDGNTIYYKVFDKSTEASSSTIFTKVTIGDVDSDTTISDITVKACAVQYAGFADAAAAYAAAPTEFLQ